MDIIGLQIQVSIVKPATSTVVQFKKKWIQKSGDPKYFVNLFEIFDTKNTGSKKFGPKLPSVENMTWLLWGPSAV